MAPAKFAAMHRDPPPTRKSINPSTRTSALWVVRQKGAGQSLQIDINDRKEVLYEAWVPPLN
jgi:hypothetical protein